MGSEPAKPQVRLLAPTSLQRGVWWWCVCIAAMVATLIGASLYWPGPTDYHDPHIFLVPLVLPAWVPVMPIGLGFSFDFIFEWIANFYPDNAGLADFLRMGAFLMFPMSFAIYITHWFLTVKAQTNRAFLLLMLSLFLLTSAGMLSLLKAVYRGTPEPDALWAE